MKRILLILSLFIVFTSCNDLSQNSSQPTNQTAQSESLKEPDDQPQIEPSKDNEPKEQDVEEQKKPVTINKDEYEIKEIHKGGEKGNHYVIVFIGDGFTKDEWNKEENKHKTFYGHIDLVKTVLFGGTVDRINYKGIEPFKSYKDYIDIYAIATISKSKNETYLQNTGTGFSDEGEQKVNLLLKELKEQYKVSPNVTHTLINSSSQNPYGRAFFIDKSFSNTVNANATIHEMGHSIGGLGDEYQANKLGDLPNVSQESEQNVPWKALNGFGGTGTVHSAHGGSFWIPTNSCMMSQNTDVGKFCEVCKYALATRMSSVIVEHEIKMYDTKSLDKVKNYDTYSNLKEHLRKNGKQNEQKQEAQNNNTRAVFPSK